MVVQLPRPGQGLPVAWWAFGPPCAGVYFPLLLQGELPYEMVNEGDHPLPGCLLWRRLLRWSQEMASDPLHAFAVREALAHLQERFDQDTRDFLAEAAILHGSATDSPPHRQVALHRLAESFMQHHLEYFDSVWSEVVRPEEVVGEPEALSVMYVG